MNPIYKKGLIPCGFNAMGTLVDMYEIKYPIYLWFVNVLMKVALTASNPCSLIYMVLPRAFKRGQCSSTKLSLCHKSNKHYNINQQNIWNLPVVNMDRFWDSLLNIIPGSKYFHIWYSQFHNTCPTTDHIFDLFI